MCLKFACFGCGHHDDDYSPVSTTATTTTTTSRQPAYWPPQQHAGYGYGGHGEQQGQGLVVHYGNGRGAATMDGYGGFATRVVQPQQAVAYTYPAHTGLQLQ